MVGFSTVFQTRNTRYKGCSESNASYFIMLAHNFKSRCWWYGSKQWTFSIIFHYILLQCDRWQQRGSPTKWHLTWKCIWSKGVSLNSSTWKKLHPLNFCLLFVCTHHCLLKVYGDQTVDVRRVKVGLPGQHFLSSDSHYSCEPVGYLHWCRFLWAQHSGSCSSVVIICSYQIVLLCSFYLLLFLWK